MSGLQQSGMQRTQTKSVKKASNNVIQLIAAQLSRQSICCCHLHIDVAVASVLLCRHYSHRNNTGDELSIDLQ